MSTDHYAVLGMMSGTSLDGLDLAIIDFINEQGIWNYEIRHAQTIEYDEFWIIKLSEAAQLSSEELLALHANYGRYLGRIAKDFVRTHRADLNLIASHGHTVFHAPKDGYSFQLGNGYALADTCGIPTICDFRSGDIILGGQGAPLVPFGDEMLFSEYSACVNLGGICNVSLRENGKRIGFDVAPCNLLLNRLSARLGKEYDEGGELARGGNLIKGVADELDAWDFFKKKGPKSLHKEDLFKVYEERLFQQSASCEDLLFTSVNHIAGQLTTALRTSGLKEGASLLLTGGGAHNKFLVEMIREKSKFDIIVPGKTLVDFKEALVFAFMGLMKYLNRVNVFASVTGARKDHSSGQLFIP